MSDFGAQDGIDLPGIPFGVHTTLGYTENASDTGGTLTVKNGTHVARREDSAPRKLHRCKLRHRGRRSWRHPYYEALQMTRNRC